MLVTFRFALSSGVLAALFISFAPPAWAVIEIRGTQATFQWEPAEGPVSGYVVFLEYNGGEPVLYSSTETNSETIRANIGDSIGAPSSGFTTTRRRRLA